MRIEENNRGVVIGVGKQMRGKGLVEGSYRGDINIRLCRLSNRDKNSVEERNRIERTEWLLRRREELTGDVEVECIKMKEGVYRVDGKLRTVMEDIWKKNPTVKSGIMQEDMCIYTNMGEEEIGEEKTKERRRKKKDKEWREISEEIQDGGKKKERLYEMMKKWRMKQNKRKKRKRKEEREE